jgi:hypothetical protein
MIVHDQPPAVCGLMLSKVTYEFSRPTTLFPSPPIAKPLQSDAHLAPDTLTAVALSRGVRQCRSGGAANLSRCGANRRPIWPRQAMGIVSAGRRCRWASALGRGGAAHRTTGGGGERIGLLVGVVRSPSSSPIMSRWAWITTGVAQCHVAWWRVEPWVQASRGAKERCLPPTDC